MGICIYIHTIIISPLCLVTLITILVGNKSVVSNYIIHCWLIKMIPKSPWLSSDLVGFLMGVGISCVKRQHHGGCRDDITLIGDIQLGCLTFRGWN